MKLVTLQFISIGFCVSLLLFLSLVLSSLHLAQASSPPGLPSTLAIATTTNVGPQQNIQLFAVSNCSARIISTVGTPVQLLFADPSNGDLSSTTLSGVKGSVQAASTTVAYDSGIYGCGRMFAYAPASTTITVIETR